MDHIKNVQFKLLVAKGEATAVDFENIIKHEGLNSEIIAFIIAYYDQDYKQEVKQLKQEYTL